jgi:hypothetical protein
VQETFGSKYHFPELKLSPETIGRDWLLEILRQRVKTSESSEPERDIVNSIKNIRADIASLKDSLSTHNELLKATNDLLLQITNSLSILESQSYFWTEEWQEAEKEATSNIATGKVHKFDDVEQLINFLHS